MLETEKMTIRECEAFAEGKSLEEKTQSLSNDLLCLKCGSHTRWDDWDTYVCEECFYCE